MSKIIVSQSHETPVQSAAFSQCNLRYAYARSNDTQKNNSTGQDYLTITANDSHLAFVLCDGVSQSYFGNIAAKLLGDQLVAWLFDNPVKLWSEEQLKAALINFLANLSTAATQIVDDHQISDAIAPMVQQVLREKKKKGSESTFVGVLMDFDSDRFVAFWMGDSRLRIWGADGEISEDVLGNHFHTMERWSTSKGLVGNLHVSVLNLSEITSISSYSDGFAYFDQVNLADSLSDAAINEMVQILGTQPVSDDISFIQVWKNQSSRKDKIQKIKAPKNIIRNETADSISLIWDEVPGVSNYRIKTNDGNRIVYFNSSSTEWKIPLSKFSDKSIEVQIEALAGIEPGEWSPAFKVELPQAVEVVPISSTADIEHNIPDLSPKPVEINRSPGSALPIDYRPVNPNHAYSPTSAEPEKPWRKMSVHSGKTILISTSLVIVFFLVISIWGIMPALKKKDKGIIRETPITANEEVYKAVIPTKIPLQPLLFIPTYTPTISPTPTSTITPKPSPTKTIEPMPSMDFGELVVIQAGDVYLAIENPEPILVPEFSIMKYEVTIGEFSSYIFANPELKLESGFIWRRPETDLPDRLVLSMPVTNISAEEAEAYCQWRYDSGSLPSETQWVRAARGSELIVYPWGNEFVQEDIFSENLGYLTPVQYYPANFYSSSGINGMIGSVWEYVLTGEGLSTVILKGGTYETLTGSPLETTIDFSLVPLSNYASDIGFRCVVNNQQP